MAVPYAFWPGMAAPPPGGVPTPLMVPPPMQPPPMMLPGMWGSGMAYGIPSIPPSAKWVRRTKGKGRADSSPLLTDPAGAIRDFTEHATNADRKQMCTVWDLQCLADWGKDEEHRKAIMGVIKARLDLPWPHNYKALDVLSVMPVSEAAGLIDKLKGFADSPASVEGAAELKKIAKPILDKAEAEKKKAEEEEMKKRQDAITAMWGGLWANGGAKAPAELAQAGWYGWQYPYQVVPGVPAQAQISWNSKAPEGWTPSSIAAVPQVYPFSRTGYYGLVPENQAPPAPPIPATYNVAVTTGGGACSSRCSTYSTFSDAIDRLLIATLLLVDMFMVYLCLARVDPVA